CYTIISFPPFLLAEKQNIFLFFRTPFFIFILGVCQGQNRIKSDHRERFMPIFGLDKPPR
ncbi:MAG: hypothetical protein PHV59_08520, partial [Victivallales bacterium]|nr:hypothetical protein [Victivallales bacterium]